MPWGFLIFPCSYFMFGLPWSWLAPGKFGRDLLRLFGQYRRTWPWWSWSSTPVSVESRVLSAWGDQSLHRLSPWLRRLFRQPPGTGVNEGEEVSFPSLRWSPSSSHHPGLQHWRWQLVSCLRRREMRYRRAEVVFRFPSLGPL